MKDGGKRESEERIKTRVGHEGGEKKIGGGKTVGGRDFKPAGDMYERREKKE